MTVKVEKGAIDQAMNTLTALIDSLDRPGGHNLITLIMFLMVPIFYQTDTTLASRLFDCCLTLVARNMVGATLTAAKDRLLTEAAQKGTGGGGTTTLTDTTTVTDGKDTPKQ